MGQLSQTDVQHASTVFGVNTRHPFDLVRVLTWNGLTVTYETTNGQRRSFRHRGASMFAVLATLILAVTGVLAFPQPAAAAPFTVDTPDGSLFPGTVTVSGSKEEGSRVQVGIIGATPYCISPGVGEPPTGETWSCTFSPGSGTYPLAITQFFDDGSIAPVTLTITVRVLTAPSLTSPALTTGLISGAGLDGAGIVVAASGPAGSYNGQCTVVQPGGFWSCPLSLPSGVYDVTVQQAWPVSGDLGPATATQSITIDKDPPAAPVITSPATGDTIATQPATYSGTGETGARVDMFVDSVLVCSAVVAGGTWSCAGTGAVAGQRLLQAIQWDPAGNPSAASRAVTVTFAVSPAPPTSTRPPTVPGIPGSPAPVPAPSPSQTAPPSTAPVFPFPLFPPPVGGESGLPPGDTWDLPTDYGAAIPAFASTDWLRALLLALAFITLVAIPLRLVVASLRGRIELRPRRFAGRNRAEPEDDTPLFSPWVTAAGALAAAIVLAALAGGVQAEVRYLRLIVAIGIALVIINGVTVAIATKSAARVLGGSAGIRLVPLLLGAAAISALLSRSLGIQPPIIVGVVIAATVVNLGTRGAGLTALAQLGSMITLGTLAWLAHSAIGPVDGLWGSLLSETLAATCIASLGSVLFLLLPVAGMPGHALLEHSPTAWFGTALVGGVITSAAIAGGATFPAGWLVGAAAVFAAVSVATWGWIRYVEPQLVETERRGA